ncbi:MAG: DNA mismatch repair endonuclease MutL [Bryobacteraceae bacterium]
MERRVLLDAGATRIWIEAEAGSTRLSGSRRWPWNAARRCAACSERHATSKLSDVKDLLSIATLGFRGEALPSIASVSRLTLETRSNDETTGALVEFAGGKLLRVEEGALATGTTITVRDLFYNVPARKKFLRSEQTELAHIASLATHYSLAYPEKGFELRHNGNELLAVTPVAELRDRVYQVFGSQIMEDLVDIGNRAREIPLDDDDQPVLRRFGLRGFISRPQVQKGNRNSIYLFVNGRLIRDRLLLHALNAAYHNLIPPNAYPFALLFFDCSPEEVDVNVHPSKTEVRFRRQSFVHDFVRDTLREVLTELRPVSSLPMQPTPQPGAQLPYSEFTQQIENQSFAPGGSEAPTGPLPEFTLRQPQAFSPPRLDFGTQPIPVGVAPAAPVSAPARRMKIPDTHGPLPPAFLHEPAPSLEVLADLRPIGQLHASFIVAAGPDGLWIIDQHVAHERILFEKVLRQMAAGQVEGQHLLMPILIDLTAPQLVEFERIAADLAAVGFEIEQFGPKTVAVKSTPADLSVAEVERVVFEILEIGEQAMRQTSVDDIRRDMAASIACRAAIKINTPLDLHRMQWMIAELAATEFPMSCPHGRPIALRYATREILRGFHRI